MHRPNIVGVVAGVASVVVAVVLGACESGSKKTVQLHRNSDAAPVIVVQREMRGDGPMVGEIEPNDEVAAAMTVAVPGRVRGTLGTEADVDMYKTIAPQSGMVSVLVGGAEDADLMVVVAVGDSAPHKSDRGPAGTIEGVRNVPVNVGQPVFVTISEFISKRHKRLRKRGKEKPRAGASKPYEVNIVWNAVGAEHQENEPNSEPGGGLMLLGDVARGYIGWKGDIDVWGIATKGFGEAYGVDVDILGVPGVALMASVRTAEGEKALITRRGVRGQSLFLRGLVPITETGLFVTVRGDRHNPHDGYDIKVHGHTIEPGYETEPNDTVDTASPAPEADGEGVLSGAMTPGDTDVWSFAPSLGPSSLSLRVSPSANVDVDVAVVVGGETVIELNAAGTGGRESVPALRIPPNQPWFVKVSGKSSGDDVATYEIVWRTASESERPSIPIEGLEIDGDSYGDEPPPVIDL